MGKVRSLDELDEVGEADESAASVKLMDEVSSPASAVTFKCLFWRPVDCHTLALHEAVVVHAAHLLAETSLGSKRSTACDTQWVRCAIHLCHLAAWHQQHWAPHWSDRGHTCVQLLLGQSVEEYPPPVVYVYESTVDCLKQTEDILANESSFGFLVDPNSLVEQSMQELMQDLCSGPNESA